MSNILSAIGWIAMLGGAMCLLDHVVDIRDLLADEADDDAEALG